MTGQTDGADGDVGPQNWYEALGNPVPYKQRARAADQARAMGLDLDGEAEAEFIDPIAKAVENDRPSEAMALARERLDLTGTYRLLAYLCVDPEAAAQSPDDGVPDDVPFGDECPACEEVWCTSMRPEERYGDERTFQPTEAVDLCLHGEWVILHSGDVTVDALSCWEIYRNRSVDIDCCFRSDVDG